MKYVLSAVILIIVKLSFCQDEIPLFGDLNYYTKNGIKEIHFIPDSIVKHDYLHLKFTPDSTLQLFYRKRERGKSLMADAKIFFDKTGFMCSSVQCSEVTKDSLGNVIKYGPENYVYDSLNLVTAISSPHGIKEYAYDSLSRVVKMVTTLETSIEIMEYNYVGDLLTEMHFQTSNSLGENYQKIVLAYDHRNLLAKSERFLLNSESREWNRVSSEKYKYLFF